MKENSREEDIEILEEKMNKELDFLIENANKTEQLTAISIIAMKEPIILLFLSVLSDYKRVLKENEYMHNELDKQQTTINKYAKENEELKETYKSEKRMKNKYVKLYQDLLLKENVIPKQKVKDKIEEIKERKMDIVTSPIHNRDEKIEILKKDKIRIQVLQELLEGRK